MNREIKFRAWDFTHKQMQYDVFPYRVIMDNKDYYVTASIFSNDDKENDKLELYLEPNSSECMQYTGLKDKNGKDIYEGDIVKYTNHSDELNILIEEVKIKIFVNGFMPFNYSLDMDYTTLEVIGNIYENPDLIK